MNNTNQILTQSQVKNKTFNYIHLNQDVWKTKGFFRGKTDSYILSMIVMFIFQSKYNSYKEGRCYQTNVYRLSNVFKLRKMQLKIHKILAASLSEYVSLLKDSLVSLYKKLYLIAVSKRRYSLYNRKMYCAKMAHSFRDNPRE